MSAQRRIRIALGLLVLAVWLPVLLAGPKSLRSRNRFGRSDVLIVTGPYRYVRHPLYAGWSFTLIGLGLVLGTPTLVVAGLVWLLVTQVWSVHEERDLARRFGSEFAAYRQRTPRLIPDVRRVLRDLRLSP